jgi:hypothetical protein
MSVQSASTPQPKKSPKVDRKRKVIDVKAEYAARMQQEKERLRLVVVGMFCLSSIAMLTDSPAGCPLFGVHFSQQLITPGRHF